MYARLQTAPTRPATDDPDKLIRRLTETISAHPGFAGLALLERDDGAGTLLTLWRTREDADLAPERTRAVAGPRPTALLADDVYEVDSELAGAAGGEPPAAALVGYFDGPLSQERIAAARRRGERSIYPVLRQLPGLVRSLVLWDAARLGFAVIHLVTAAEVVPRIGATVTTVPLAEDDDPALLIGPSRVEPHRVLAYEPGVG